jgi:hypothetical protein
MMLGAHATHPRAPHILLDGDRPLAHPSMKRRRSDATEDTQTITSLGGIGLAGGALPVGHLEDVEHW